MQHKSQKIKSEIKHAGHEFHDIIFLFIYSSGISLFCLDYMYRTALNGADLENIV